LAPASGGTLIEDLSQHLLGVSQALRVLKRATRTAAEAAAKSTGVSQNRDAVADLALGRAERFGELHLHDARL